MSVLDPAVTNLIRTLRVEVDDTKINRKMLWEYHKFQMKGWKMCCTKLKNKAQVMGQSEGRSIVDDVYCVLNRLNSLQRLLNGGPLACWSQFTDTQHELKRAEIELLRIFKYDDKAIEDTRNNRADAMKKDLNNLLKCIEGSFKKVWGKDQNLKNTSDVELWKLLSPVDIQGVRISYVANNHHRFQIWCMMHEVANTFSQTPLTSVPSSRNELKVEQLRKELTTELNKLKGFAAAAFLDDQRQDTNAQPQRPIVLRKLGRAGIVRLILSDFNESTLVGTFQHKYCSDPKIIGHVKCYDLPHGRHVRGSQELYTPLKHECCIGNRTTLLLVDEGAEFVIAVVVDNADGVALLFDDRTVGDIIAEKYRCNFTTKVYHLEDLDGNTDLSGRSCRIFKSDLKCKLYHHCLDIVCEADVPLMEDAPIIDPVSD